MNSRDDNVGYRKPPKHSQFRKGRSGNPRGRPKRIPTIKESLEKELHTLVTVTEDGKKKKLPRSEVFAKKLWNQALKDNAPQYLVKLLLSIGPPPPEGDVWNFRMTESAQKLIDQFLGEDTNYAETSHAEEEVTTSPRERAIEPQLRREFRRRT